MAARKPPSTRIDLEPGARERISRAAEAFFADNWDEPVSALRLQMFVDWLQDEAGHLFYNRGIQDAMAASTLAQARLHDDLDLLRKLG